MNNVIATNNLSLWLNTLKSQSLTEIYSYGIYDNIPDTAVRFVSVRPDIPPSTTSPYLADVNYKIPAFGLLKMFWVKTQFTTTVAFTEADATNVGQRMFSRDTLNYQGGIICTNTPHFKAGKTSILDICESQEHSRLTQPNRTLATGVVVTLMTPFYCANFEKPNLYLNTKKVQQLYYSGTINNQIDMNFDGATFTGFTQTLECQFVDMSEKMYALYLAQQFPNGNALNMITYETVHQQFIEPTTIATSGTMEISLAGVVPQQFVSVNALPISTGTCITAGGGYQPNTGITSLSLSFNGVDVYTSVPAETLRAIASQYSCGQQHCTLAGASTRLGNFAPATKTLQAPIALFWSQYKDATFNSGCVAYSYVHNPQLIVNHNAADVSTSRVTVDLVSVVFSNLIIDATNGYIQVARSS